MMKLDKGITDEQKIKFYDALCDAAAGLETMEGEAEKEMEDDKKSMSDVEAEAIAAL